MKLNNKFFESIYKKSLREATVNWDNIELLQPDDYVWWYQSNRPMTGASAGASIDARVISVDVDNGIVKVQTIGGSRGAYKGTFADHGSNGGRIMNVDITKKDLHCSALTPDGEQVDHAYGNNNPFEGISQSNSRVPKNWKSTNQQLDEIAHKYAKQVVKERFNELATEWKKLLAQTSHYGISDKHTKQIAPIVKDWFSNHVDTSKVEKLLGRPLRPAEVETLLGKTISWTGVETRGKVGY